MLNEQKQIKEAIIILHNAGCVFVSFVTRKLFHKMVLSVYFFLKIISTLKVSSVVTVFFIELAKLTKETFS